MLFSETKHRFLSLVAMVLTMYDNNKNHQVRCSVQPEPSKKSPSRNPESEGRRVSALVISSGVLVEQNTDRVWSLFLSRDFLNLYLHGELFLLSYCHLPKFFTSNLLWFNVHLNCLSLDNHLVSNQPQWQCYVTITSHRVLWPNRFWILLDGAKLEKIKTNDLTIIWAWYDHNLLTYIFYARVM